MEEQISTSQPQIITDPVAADVLVNTQTRKLITPFLGKAQTVAVAANELDMSTSALLYQVNKLLNLGILKIVREEPRAGRASKISRAGRASKIYSTTSPSYFVPFRVTRAETLEGYLHNIKHYYEQLLTTSIAQVMEDMAEDWGVKIYRDDKGKPNALMAVYPDKVMRLEEVEPAVLDFYCPDLFLDFTDAKALQRELGEVFQKYMKKGGSQRYLWHAGLTPISSEIDHWDSCL
ncbi:MAG: hypothetical protein AAFW84_30200 [Cyanobacteria bacterium J06635_15]